MAVRLRPYQEECVDAIHESFREFDKSLIVLATGLGKTIVANSIASDICDKGGRVLFLAHREELLQQASDKMEMFHNIKHQLVKSGNEFDMSGNYYVASVQTLCKEEYLNRFPVDFFNLIICDEAHHAMSETYQSIFDYFTKTKTLGMSIGGESVIEMIGGVFNEGFIGSIEEAFNIAKNKYNFVYKDGYEVVFLEDVYSRSFDGKKFLWEKCTKIIRHFDTLGGKEVFLTPNRTIYLTNDHSVFRISGKKNMSIECIETSEVKKGDVFIGDDGGDLNIGEEQAINVCEKLDNKNIRIEIDISKISDNDWKKMFPEKRERFARKKSGSVNIKQFREFKKEFNLTALKIKTEGCSDTWLKPEIKLSDFAYLIGFFYGDGWFANSSNSVICLAAENKIVSKVIDKLSKIESAMFNIRTKNVSTTTKQKELFVQNPVFSMLLSGIVGDNKCYDKAILPEFVYRWGKNERRELLEGLVDSDGHLEKNTRNRVRYVYTTTSIGLRDSIIVLIKSLGGNASYYTAGPSEGGVINGRKIVGKHERYNIYWSGNSILGINYGHKGKRSKYNHGDISFDEVVVRKIYDDKRDYVYDLEMEKNHCFVANNILVHNTATPSRSDQKKLSSFFETKAYEYDLEDAIKDGWLSNIICRTANIEVDLSKVRTVAGDFVVNELDNAIIKNFRGISRYIKNNLMTRKKILIFTPRVASAELLSIALKKEGLTAEFVCGESKNRKDILLKYNRGEIQVLCNSLLLCLSMDTEILTNRGFVRHEHLLSDDLVANWDNGNVYFEKPKHVFSREVGPGETFVEHNGSISSFKVTNNHNMVVRRGRRWIKKAAEDISRGIFPACGVSEPFTITIKQDERQKVNRRISANSYNYRKSNPNMTHEESVNLAVERIEADTRKKKQPNELTLDECRFIGFWIADGSVNHLRKGGVEYTLCQSERYGEIIFWIDNVLKNIGVDFLKKRKSPSSKTTNCHYIWSVPRGTGFGCQKRNGVYHLEPYLKKSSNDLLWALNEEQFDALIEGYWYGDGNHLGAESGFPKSISFNDTHLDFIDQLCAIGSVRGWRCATSLRKSKDVRHKDQLYLRMIKNANINIGSGYITKNVKPEEGEHVWCVKTSSGNIITRRNGKVMVMGNCEGFDEPEIDCIINLRPTQSKVLHKQILGRGTRIHQEKENVLIVDCLWKTDRFVINPCSLFAKSDSVATAMRDFLVLNTNKSYDLSKLSSYVDMVMGGIHLMEGARRKAKEEISKRGKNSPETFAFFIDDRDILEYEPIFEWEYLKPTPKQIEFLEDKCKISCKKVNKGLASKLISAIVQRIEENKCSVKQMFFLAQKGIFDRAPNLSMGEASRIMDAVSKNNWIVPYGMLKEYGGTSRLDTPLIKIEDMKIEPVEEGQKTWAQPI